MVIMEIVATAFSTKNIEYSFPLRRRNLVYSTPSKSLEAPEDLPDLEKNEKYVEGLIENFTQVLDRWVVLRSDPKKEQVQNILNQIRRESKVDSLTAKAIRLAERAGFPMDENQKLGENDPEPRRRRAEDRKQWEKFRENVEEVGNLVARGKNGPRSALSAREANNGKPDLFLGQMDERLTNDKSSDSDDIDPATLEGAQLRNSEIVAKSGSQFDGETMGIGGLDDVLSQVKRRVWIPLAAPPILLNELGISPVRGLLLYGRPGCGKTLIARTIGRILSPSRPVTVVSGPELMDKFVGSSEQNVRRIFDDPPPIYDDARVHESDDGAALSKVALHVIIMDEFDAMARSRGGKAGNGDQGEAGVARDSVVNQILAKMDGVDPLPVPTLVIGMTNKRSLIDSALLRPGRFEVQIEVPPPKTEEQRISILKVHMKTMLEAGRLLVNDAPAGTAADRFLQNNRDNENIISYELLLKKISSECEGFSGASLAGVARAAASHALERAVTSLSSNLSGEGDVIEEEKEQVNVASDNNVSILDCLVTLNDLELAVGDIKASSGESDWSEDEEEKVGEPLTESMDDARPGENE